MASSINELWPQAGNALTANVRANFLAAKNEIEALQAQATGFTADGSMLYLSDYLEIGDPGFEAAGIDINGTVYAPKLRINDIGGSNPAQVVLHRHSTTLPSVIIGARANDDTTSHTAVTVGQSLLSIYGVGYSGSHYDIFGGIHFSVDAAGTISATSSPGQIIFQTTPDGSNTPVTAMTLDSGQHLILPQVDDAVTPTFAFGDGDTGFYESADDVLYLSNSGVNRFFSSGNTWGAAASSGPALKNQGATGTVPTIFPNRGDSNTGLGLVAADNLSLIAGGLEAIRAEDPADLAATETSLWLYDLDGAAIKQVTVGADDSGGSGYKYLRVAN